MKFVKTEGSTSFHSDVLPPNRQKTFSGRSDEYSAHKILFSGHMIQKYQMQSIFSSAEQSIFSSAEYLFFSLTASKMTVLQHFVEELEALAILQQKIHCTTTAKLVMANFKLAGYFSRRKHGLSTFVYERLNWTLCSQSSPISDTE